MIYVPLQMRNIVNKHLYVYIQSCAKVYKTLNYHKTCKYVIFLVHIKYYTVVTGIISALYVQT